MGTRGVKVLGVGMTVGGTALFWTGLWLVSPGLVMAFVGAVVAGAGAYIYVDPLVVADVRPRYTRGGIARDPRSKTPPM
jgi:hypothetical protein